MSVAARVEGALKQWVKEDMIASYGVFVCGEGKESCSKTGAKCPACLTKQYEEYMAPESVDLLSKMVKAWRRAPTMWTSTYKYEPSHGMKDIVEFTAEIMMHASDDGAKIKKSISNVGMVRVKYADALMA